MCRRGLRNRTRCTPSAPHHAPNTARVRRASGHSHPALPAAAHSSVRLWTRMTALASGTGTTLFWRDLRTIPIFVPADHRKIVILGGWDCGSPAVYLLRDRDAVLSINLTCVRLGSQGRLPQGVCHARRVEENNLATRALRRTLQAVKIQINP